MDWLCRGNGLHPSVKLETLGTSPTLYMYESSLDFVCKFLIRNSCHPPPPPSNLLLFQVTGISYSFWSLSMVLWIFWSSSRLPTSLLFSVVPRHLEYVGLHQCSETSEAKTSASSSHQRIWNFIHMPQLFLSLERNWVLEIFPCSFHTKPRGGTLVSKWMLVQTLSIFSVALNLVPFPVSA